MTTVPHKRAKLAAWLFFVLFFLMYMFNTDRLYNALSGKAYAVKLPVDLPLHAKGEVQYNWRPWGIEPINNRFEAKLRFNGSVGKVANTSGHATLRFFVKSAGALYEVTGCRHTFKADTNEIMVNFFAAASRLDNGIYTVGVYLADDDGERFAWMDSLFEKVAGGPVEYIARPVALPPATVSQDLKFALEPICMENGAFIFQGCAVLDNAEMDDYNAYITVRTPDDVVKTFYAPLFTRMDVASMYEDSRAANSGFRIKIPEGEFSSGEHAIKVLIRSRKTGRVIESAQTESRNLR